MPDGSCAVSMALERYTCECKQTIPYQAVLDHLKEVVTHGSVMADEEDDMMYE